MKKLIVLLGLSALLATTGAFAASSYGAKADKAGHAKQTSAQEVSPAGEVSDNATAP